MTKKSFRHRTGLLFFVLLLSISMIMPLHVGAAEVADKNINNRFNVVVVLDASGSMNDNDPNGFRYEAITQFTNLLAEQGNYLGSVVFSTEILAKMEPAEITSQKDKDQAIQEMQSVSASGWTNLGEALIAAVNSLTSNGDPNLPSVIVLLSDGNTEMPTQDETDISLDSKADAIQCARENNIPIYSVCLNADNTADVSEMKQISVATGGEFQEVSSAQDLNEVFNVFYNLIYGTSTIMLVDEVFPDSGIVEKEFEIPGIGVEEVNIIIYGKPTNFALKKPDGSESQSETKVMNSFTMVKITDIEPGTWRVITTGVPGDQIKINMVYNTNLGVDIKLLSDAETFTPEDTISIIATLRSGDQVGTLSEQYMGYSAELHLLDAYGDETGIVPMDLADDHFEVSTSLDEGAYYFLVSVEGNYIHKESETIGPFVVSLPEPAQDEDEEPEVNTPPIAFENPVQKTVLLWPFIDNSLDIDLTKLASDDQDEDIRYKIISSSFIEDEDYTVDSDGQLSIQHFSLSKGAFTIRAIDSGGLFCDIELIIVSHNVGIIALIVLGIAIIIVLAVIGFITYHELGLAFMGEIHAENLSTRDETVVTPKRGRYRLGAVAIGSTGFDSKCYFQATGKNFIWFKSRKPVISDYSSKPEKKIKLQSGFDTNIYPSVETRDEQTGGINIRFDSFLDTDL